MRIEYTDYAKTKIRKRELSKSQIENALKNPDDMVEGKEGRKIAQKLAGKHLLRVVFEQHENTYRVITAYYAEPERYK